MTADAEALTALCGNLARAAGDASYSEFYARGAWTSYPRRHAVVYCNPPTQQRAVLL